MNKPVYLGLSILELSKILLYDHVKPEYGEKAKSRYMNTDNTYDIYKDYAEDIETRFDTSNYKLDRILRKAKNEKLIVLMKDELGGKKLQNLLGLEQKLKVTCQLMVVKKKKAKVCHKKKLKFENYKNCLEATHFHDKIIFFGKKLTQIVLKKIKNYS